MTNPDPGPDEIYPVGVNTRRLQASDEAEDETPLPTPEIAVGWQ